MFSIYLLIKELLLYFTFYWSILLVRNRSRRLRSHENLPDCKVQLQSRGHWAWLRNSQCNRHDGWGLMVDSNNTESQYGQAHFVAFLFFSDVSLLVYVQDKYELLHIWWHIWTKPDTYPANNVWTFQLKLDTMTRDIRDWGRKPNHYNLNNDFNIITVIVWVFKILLWHYSYSCSVQSVCHTFVYLYEYVQS